MDVVTGAAGFVGSVLVDALVGQGRRVRAVVRRAGSARPGVEEVVADVRDPDAIRRALAGAERVFHCAARISIAGDEDGAVHATNVLGARNVASAAAGSRVVHVSSVHAFALDEEEVTEQSPRPPPDGRAYDRSKAESEEALRGVAVIVNPTGIFGPGDRGPSRMGGLVRWLDQGRLPAIVDGAFDWVDVRDVVSGILLAAERGRMGENYLLGGERASLRQIARLVHAAGGARPPLLDAPRWLAWAAAPLAQALQTRLGQEPVFTREALATLWSSAQRVSWDKAAGELGYRPRPLAGTVADTVRWFREEASR